MGSSPTRGKEQQGKICVHAVLDIVDKEGYPPIPPYREKRENGASEMDTGLAVLLSRDIDRGNVGLLECTLILGWFKPSASFAGVTVVVEQASLPS